LRECITLQLKELNLFTIKTAQIVENLDQLAKGNLEQLKRKYSISDSDMIAIIKSIRSVNPKPGSEFYSSDEPIVAPDLKIIRKGDQWTVQLFSSNIPTISIQKDFAKTAISNALSSDHLDFLKTSLSEANWLKRAIAQRNETTLKIGLAILKFQLSYFDRGPAYLVPLTLKDIAEEIGVHESTVSRATNSSLIETPFGVLPLKFFFSSKIDSENSSSTQSGASMRHKIADLIRNERPSSPLSDEAIVEEFKRMGTTIARRTVAKYRKMENIPSSFDRKKQFILKGLVS
jgi:RNA polymerase sigma-54 factor